MEATRTRDRLSPPSERAVVTHAASNEVFLPLRGWPPWRHGTFPLARWLGGPATPAQRPVGAGALCAHCLSYGHEEPLADQPASQVRQRAQMRHLEGRHPSEESSEWRVVIGRRDEERPRLAPRRDANYVHRPNRVTGVISGKARLGSHRPNRVTGVIRCDNDGRGGRREPPRFLWV